MANKRQGQSAYMLAKAQRYILAGVATLIIAVRKWTHLLQGAE